MNKKSLVTVGLVILLVVFLYYLGQSKDEIADTNEEIAHIPPVVLPNVPDEVPTIEKIAILEAPDDQLTVPAEFEIATEQGTYIAMLKDVPVVYIPSDTPPQVDIVEESLVVRLDAVLVEYDNLTPVEKNTLGPELKNLVTELIAFSEALKMHDAGQIVILNESLQTLVNVLEKFILVLEKYIVHIKSVRII